MKAQGVKYLWLAACFLCSMMTMFIVGQTVHAEETSTIIIKEPSGQAPKVVVRPQKRSPNSKYNVILSPIKTVAPIKQRNVADKPTRSREENDKKDSRFKTGIRIAPIDETIPASSVSGEGKGDRRRAVPERSGMARRIQEKSIGDAKSENKVGVGEKGISNAKKILSADQTEKAGEKFEPMTGPIKQTDDKSSGDVKSPISGRVKVTRVQSWKLDVSGNKTNEQIIDDPTVIEGINQPPSDVSPK